MEKNNYWQRRLSRRRVLRSAALGSAGLAAAAVIGCGEEEKPAAAPTGTRAPAATAAPGSPVATPTPAAKQPKRGGKLARRQGPDGISFSSGFDPHILNAFNTSLMGLFYQNLVSYHDVTLEPQPEIAQRWEQPSDNEYVFRLAPDIKWHNKPPVNGRGLTADDVVFSLNRVRTDEPKFFLRSLLASVDKIEALDRRTLRITTKVPDASLLLNLAEVSVLVLAPEVLEKFDKLASAEHVVGTGAFVLQSFEDSVRASLVRNPEYWKPGLPYLDSVELPTIRDPGASYAAFLAGQLDIEVIPGQETKKFLTEHEDKIVGWAKDIVVQHLWQNTQRKPFDDRRVNRALRLLVDHTEAKTAWAEVWFGRGNAGNSHIPGLLEAWDFSEKEYLTSFLEWKQPKDEAIREALSLLSSAGFNKNAPLKFQITTTTAVPNNKPAELLQAQYRRFAPDVVVVDNIKFLDNTTSISAMARGEFEVAGPVARAGHTDPDQALTSTYRSKGSQNFGKWSDPKADEMIDRQRATFDIGKRKALVKEILLYLIEHAPYTGWASGEFLNAAQPKVRGMVPQHRTRFRSDLYERVWLDT